MNMSRDLKEILELVEAYKTLDHHDGPYPNTGHKAKLSLMWTMADNITSKITELNNKIENPDPQ